MITRLRYKYSFKFGRIEHTTSRVLFWILVVTYLSFVYYHFVNDVPKNNITNYLMILCILLWLIYWGAHRMEKLLHPKH